MLSWSNLCHAGTRLQAICGACSFYFGKDEVNRLMNLMKKVVNFKVNRVNDEPKWFTLQEASRVTGLNTFTIRKRIKTGKLMGKKVNQKNKEVWFVSCDSIKDCAKVDGERLNSKVNDEPGSELVHDELVDEPMMNHNSHMDLLLQEKDERIGELVHHKGILEHLLKEFQERMIALEAERNDLHQKIRLLPAPVEVMPAILKEKEAKFSELEAELLATKSALENERSRSWWQKLWRK